MDHHLQHLLRLALHQFLDLCRDVRGIDLDAGTRDALSKAELYAWKCLAE